MRAILVTHSHWDREWYRTFQDFRAQLVDLVDRVIELCEADPNYRFLLDGQTVVLEDYLEIRPTRATALRALAAEGRIALGPWYVQPDSLLPSGEAHVRNLLLGRSVGETVGPVSRAGYTPDSFGHPAQFPQLLAGFGIESFIYWRGNGAEITELPAEYDWQAPDGSRVIACHLGKGYFGAATAPRAELAECASLIAQRAKELAERTQAGAILLMNGIDHAMPEARTKKLCEEISRISGLDVQRGLLDDFAAIVSASEAERPTFSGELVGGRVAPLLPGVWSTRTWIKLANRHAEAALEGWAEPFAALGRIYGLPDEAPSLHLAWKELLKNQAHDSICGCSRDEVHEQMRSRFDNAGELADQTTKRCLERLAGLGAERLSPWSDEFDLVVVNPSARNRTDRVRFAMDFRPFMFPDPNPALGLHPTVLHDLGAMRFTVDGAPARLVPAETGRMKLIPERGGFDLEFVARDVPAMGFQRVRVRRAAEGSDNDDRVEVSSPGQQDASIAVDDIEVSARADGCFDLRMGNQTFSVLGALESTGDRGDTYDYDEVRSDSGLELESVSVERRCHPSGLQELRIVRELRVASRLAPNREQRSSDTSLLELETVLQLTPGVPRLDLDLRVQNAAQDHRLRMLFPVAESVQRFEAATTFDVVERTPGPRDDTGWVQAAPATFAHQGFVHAGGLCVVAPGLPEAEVTRDQPASIAITLLRCVGSLSRPDLRSRPGPAGPGTDTPGAQCPGPLRARLSLIAGLDPAAAREAELGLRAVLCGDSCDVPEGRPFVKVDPSSLLLSAFKPAESGAGVVLRLLNPTSTLQRATVTLGFPFEHVEAVRLDEQVSPEPIAREGPKLRFPVPPHALRSVRIS